MSGGDEKEGEKSNGSSVVFYEQLQSEYNKLLKRYAEAENTIDELRTGARINLFSNSPSPRPHSRGTLETVRHSQRIHFPRPLQAVVSPASTDENTRAESTTGHCLISDRRVNTDEPLPVNSKQENLEGRIKVLKENVDSLENCLAESDMTSATLNEVFTISNELEKERKGLSDELKNIKQSRRPSTRREDEPFHFASKNDLEKELYRIGLRLQEIQQDVSGRLKSSKEDCGNSFEEVGTRNLGNLVDQRSQGESPLDPALENLIMKLKGLRDSSVRSSEEILNNSRGDDKKEASSRDGQFAEEPAGSHSLSSLESRDTVDARYLAASPVHVEHSQPGIPGEAYLNDIDVFTYEDGQTSDVLPDVANGHRSSGLNVSTRDLVGQPNYSEHPRNVCDSESSNEDHANGNQDSLSQSPLSDGGHGDHFHGKSSSQVLAGSSHEHGLHRTKVGKNVCARENQPRKSNSMSSLADSSRMSTPLFQPRGAARVSPRGAARVSPRGATDVVPLDQRRMKYKRYNPTADGFDSGFVGSEESRSSRLATESPDIMRKLNLSNHWDSSLHLDLSEIDENDSMSSQEQLSTTYELVTELERHSKSPVTVDRTSRDTPRSSLLNSSPSPPSSPKPRRYYEYSKSRGTNRRSPSDTPTPVPQEQLAEPSLSRISERPASERSSQIETTSGANRDNTRGLGGYSRSGSRETSSNNSGRHSRLSPRKLRESTAERRANADRERDSVLSLRDDISGLRQQIEHLLNQPRVTLDMYYDLRREDEDSRKTLERENERKLDELRRNFDRLASDFRSKTNPERHRPPRRRDSNSYDDLRNQVKNLSEKLDGLRMSDRDRPVSSGAPSASFGNDIAERFTALAHRVDELRNRVENEEDTERPYVCYLCDDTTSYHHGYHPVLLKSKPRTSTPLLSEIYETSRQSKMKAERPPTLRNLSSTYPGVLARSPVVHHVHTYHTTPWVEEKIETDSSSEGSYITKRNKPPKRSRRRRYHARHDSSHGQHLALTEAQHAAQDIQRLSTNILNKMSLDLASFTS